MLVEDVKVPPIPEKSMCSYYETSISLPGTHALSKLSTLPRDQCICKFCNDRVVEDVKLHCTNGVRSDLLEKGGFECYMSHVLTIYSMGDKGGMSKWTKPKRGVFSVCIM